MGVTAATAAMGTLIQRSTDGVTYTTIAEVTSFDGPSATLNLLDATHMESPDNYMEYIASLKDGGELSLQVSYLPTNNTQNVLQEDLDNRTKQYWKVQWTDAVSSYATFRGFVTNFSHSGGVDTKLDASITIKITGKVTFTEGT